MNNQRRDINQIKRGNYTVTALQAGSLMFYLYIFAYCTRDLFSLVKIIPSLEKQLGIVKKIMNKTAGYNQGW